MTFKKELDRETAILLIQKAVYPYHSFRFFKPAWQEEKLGLDEKISVEKDLSAKNKR